MNSVGRNPIFWLLILFLFLVSLVLYFSAVLTPFVCAMILSYLLTPLVNWFSNSGLSRSVSGFLVLLLSMSLLVGSIIFLLPILISQVEMLLSSLPELYEQCLLIFERVVPQFLETKFFEENEFAEIQTFLKNQGLQVASQMASYALKVVDFLVLIFVIPLITFYLLIDWEKIISIIGKYFPKDSSKELSEVVLQIDSLLSGFIRGQLTICIALGIFYSVLLSSIGLNYGLLIGFFAGIISFIPYLGAALGALIAISVSLYQFWDNPIFLAYVGVIFVAGQFLESNFFTPKLIGNAVKLHPVLIMLSISVGGSVAGLTGVLLSVPLAGILGVLLRRLGEQYLQSAFFMGAKTDD